MGSQDGELSFPQSVVNGNFLYGHFYVGIFMCPFFYAGTWLNMYMSFSL